MKKKKKKVKRTKKKKKTKKRVKVKRTKKVRKVKKIKRVKKAKRKKKPSIRELTIDILKRTKQSMHYRDITKRLKKRGYKFHRKDPERSVYIIINRYPKIFKRVKPAVYRLR